MSRLQRLLVYDPYPEVVWAQFGSTIGSVGNFHYFRIRVLGGLLECHNTAPPSYTQTNQYDQTMFTGSPRFFGAPVAFFQAAIIDNYEWRITAISNMSSLTGVTVNTWNAFTDTYVNGRLTFTGGTGSYRIEIRDKNTLETVGSFTYTITGA